VNAELGRASGRKSSQIKVGRPAAHFASASRRPSPLRFPLHLAAVVPDKIHGGRLYAQRSPRCAGAVLYPIAVGQ
jgi:hypothetical protein